MAELAESFAGTIPANYELYLVPTLFERLADEMARRVAALSPAPKTVLETAAGTGAVSHLLPGLLSADASLTVTDLNPDMLEIARPKLNGHRNVEIRQADAKALPFADDSFDLVVCQIGFMFFADKVASFGEAARVLKPGGTLLFSVWDSIAGNDFVRTLITAFNQRYGSEALTFFDTPYGWYHLDTIRAHLEAAGFHSLEFAIVAQPSPSDDACNVALGYLTGTPFSLQLAKYATISLDEAADAITEAVTQTYGNPPLGAQVQAIFVSARQS